MKTLILLRHAKSSWEDRDLADFDRPLAPRGRKAASKVGRALAERGWTPDRVLLSPAARTRQTWDSIAAEMGDVRPDIRLDETLYAAPPGALLAALRKTSEDVADLLLIGHNPGLEELARDLSGDGSEPGALAQMIRKFPTAAFARLTFTGQWRTLDIGLARLLEFLRPKELY